MQYIEMKRIHEYKIIVGSGAEGDNEARKQDRNIKM